MSTKDSRVFKENCDFLDYLKTGKSSALLWDDAQVFLNNGYKTVLKNDCFYCLEVCASNLHLGLAYTLSFEIIAGVVLKHLKHFRTKKAASKSKARKNIVLLNGDDSVDAKATLSLSEDCPRTSFECLGQFYDSLDKPIHQKLVSGELVILDFTSDHSIALTSLEKRHHTANLEKRYHTAKIDLIPPKRGYSVIGSGKNRVWHKSGNVLFWDTKKSFCILTGQDEGTYFGVELDGYYRTVESALESLIPHEIRKKKLKRQGEWFFVEVEVEKVPTNLDCIIQLDSNAVMPVENSGSNEHHLSFSKGVVGKDSNVYVLNPVMTHQDHETLYSQGWHTIHRNTAVRSFSQNGVD